MTTDNTQAELEEILAKVSGESFDTAINNPNDYMLVLNAIEVRAKQAILDWHNKQVEEAMAKFHLKKGVKYDVKASDSVIVITHTNKLKERDDE